MSKGTRIEHKFINNIEHKLCGKCNNWFSLDKFAKDNTRWDKLRERCKECRKITRNSKQEEEYRLKPENKIKKSEYDREYAKTERDYEKEYQNDKRNPQRYIALVMRNRMNMAVECMQKSGSVIDDLGCTIEEFIKYVESKFYPHPITNEQMTWQNWGRGYGRWQLDHIIELHKFDLTNRLDFLKACHYTNIKPLWYEDHIKKGTRPKRS